MHSTWPGSGSRSRNGNGLAAGRDCLFSLLVRRLDDRPPPLGLSLVEDVKCFWRLLIAREYLLADSAEPLAYRRVSERLDNHSVEFQNYLLRRALGDPQPMPE